MSIKRFTAYRYNISQRDTHNELQKNADHLPQFEGVIWTDGTVTLRWLTACKSTSVWASIEDCLNIHGHPEYGTVIEWHDADAPEAWVQQCAAAIRSRGEKPYATQAAEVETSTGGRMRVDPLTGAVSIGTAKIKARGKT